MTERRTNGELRQAERRHIHPLEPILERLNYAERCLELYIDGIMRNAGLDPDAD